MSFMKILHIASEFAPLAKVGGMSDVLLGLARASVEQGHDVTVMLPKYSTIDIECQKLEDFSYTYDGKPCSNTLWMACYENVPLILVETKTPHKFFQRERIYGEKDDTDRFAYFCKLVACYLQSRIPPDVIHVHDWHTALIPLLYQKTHSVLTLHNLAYPGACELSTLEKIGLKESEIKALKCNGHYSLLQGGIEYADHITTVSPTYAQEILTPEYGGPFCSYLNQNKKKLSGILNGIDYTYWNPQTDPHLPAHFNLEKLDNKHLVKEALQKRLGLSAENKILVSAIARLVPQKGPKLIEAALRKTVSENGQFVLLGAASDPATKQLFLQLKMEYAQNKNVHIELVYDEALAHLVFAASDMLIVPSIFEPCGLTQMIAMRYGAVPLVRQTGGLADTVFEGKNGFCFGPATEAALSNALDRSFACWNSEPEKWKELIENGMREDFSWKKPAEAYLELYKNSSKPSVSAAS